MPIRRNQEMHRGRISQGSNIYFVTCCLKSRINSRLNESALARLTSLVRAMDASGDTLTLAFTGMSDHFHWLFKIGERLPLRQVVAKLKFLSRQPVAASNAAWQRDYYEHRVRSQEMVEDYALYIFLNAYRAGLLRAGDAGWPFWWTAQPETLGFIAKLNPDGSPPPEWMGREIPAGVGDVE